MQDSPTQNWSTYNPLYIQEPNSDRRPNFINANLGMAANNSSKTAPTLSTIGISQNIYAEVHVTKADSNTTGIYPAIRIATQRDQDSNPQYEFYGDQTWSDLGTGKPSGNDAWTTGDVVRVAIDYAGRTCQIAVNGGAFASTDISAMTEEPWTLTCKNAESATNAINYGQQPFLFDVPAGFEPLQTQNLPASPIPNGRDHFRAITGPGQGATGTGPNFGNWSSFTTQNTASAGTISNGFDGSTGTFWSTASATPADATFTPQQAITGVTSLRVFISTGTGWSAIYNGVTTNLPNANDWNNIPLNGATEISATVPLVIRRDSGFTGWSAIEVNGLILTDLSILAAARRTFDNGLWWIKDRVNSNQHQLVDSVRGGDLASIIPGVNTQDTDTAYVAPAGDSVAWCWNAGGPPVVNNDGNIPVNLSLNKKAQFSIGTYAGQAGGAGAHTVGTGLDDPKLVMIRRRDLAVNGINTFVLHKDLTPGSWYAGGGRVLLTNYGQVLLLNSNSGAVPYIYADEINNAGNNYVMYAWGDVPGYSAIGSYTGNNDPDGPFIYTGFRPAFILCKRVTGGSTEWIIQDSTRSQTNPSTLSLFPSTAQGEIPDFNSIDFLSNGFKMRSNSQNTNVATTYVYAAFAENPFGGSNVSPATAR